MRKTVTYPIKDLKAPDSRGVFEAWVAETYPEDAPKEKADADGDIFMTAAFDEEDGKKIPVFYQHDYSPTSEVGEARLAPLTSRKVLPAFGQLFVGQGRPIAEAVYEMMLLPESDPQALHEFSVGYDFDPKDAYVREDGVRIIRKSKIFEISVVYKGAQRTELVSVKAGRVLSAKNEASLRQAVDLHRQALDVLQGVLSSLEKAEPEKSATTITITTGDTNSTTTPLVPEIVEIVEPEATPQDDENKQKRDELIRRIRMLTMDVA